MAQIILDTNIISEAYPPDPPEWLKRWLMCLPAGSLVIPWVAIYEVQYGISCAERENPRLANSLIVWFEELLDQRLEVLEMPLLAARLLGRMAACPHLRHHFETEAKTNKLGEKVKNDRIRLGGDAMLAALAIVHQLPIATRNIRDFVHIDRYFRIPGLFDPSRDEWILDPPVGWGLSDNANDDNLSDFCLQRRKVTVPK